MDLLEKLKELVAKAVTVVGTVFISNNGFDALLQFMNAGNNVPLKLLSIVAGYAVWTQVIIPFVDGMFKEATKTVNAVDFKGPTWNTRSKLF